MGIEWKSFGNNDVEIGVDWQAVSNTTSVDITIKVYRWDRCNTANTGTYHWYETLNPEPGGSTGSWTIDATNAFKYNSGGETKLIDTFGKRTYDRTTSSQTVKLTIKTDDGFGTWDAEGNYFDVIGAHSDTWTLTIDPLPSVTVRYAPNAGSITTGTAATRYKASGGLVYRSTDSGSNWSIFTNKYYRGTTHNNLTNVGTFPITRTGYYVNSTNAYYASINSTTYYFHQDDTSTANTTNVVSTKRLNGGTEISSNITRTLYVNWQPNTYTISFNANGGTGAPSSQTKTQDAALTLSSTKPTKSGYKFLGWATTTNATSATYTAGGTVTAGALNATTTLYAVWTVAKATVNIHANTGTITESGNIHYYGTGATRYKYRVNSTSKLLQYQKSTDSGATYDGTWKDDFHTVLSTDTHKNLTDVSTYGVTKTGYHVVSSYAYNLKADGTGNSFSQNENETADNLVTTKRLNNGTEITDDVTRTLYMNWKINTYTVSYNANGGSPTPASQTKTYGTDLTLTSTTPTHAAATANVTITFSTDSGTITPTSRTSLKTTQQLFNYWKSSSNVTYAAGGVYKTEASTTMTAQWKDGTTTYAQVTLATGTRTNHTLQGWYTVSAATGGTLRGAPGATYTPSQGEVLYARWGYNITYKPNGGNSTPTAQVKTHGTSITLAAGITRNSTTATVTVTFSANGGSVSPTTRTATKTTSYTFSKWKANDTAGTLYNAKASYTLNEPVELTAQWTSTVSPATISLPIPIWNGRTPVGWYTDTTWTTKRGDAGGTYTTTNSETLYARWQRTVTYNKNTTASVSNLPASQTDYTYNTITLSSTIPTWTDHNFYRWNTAADRSGTYYSPGAAYSGTDSLDLYAIWTYTINYNANGGTNGPSSHTQWVGENIKIAEEPVRDGYKFSKWSTTSDGSGTSYGRGTVYTGQSNLTLYAIWTKENTVSDLENVSVAGGNRFVPSQLISQITNKIAPYFYGDILYNFTGTIDWSTIRTANPLPSSETQINLSAACYNYKRIVVVGRTYHNTYVATTILNPTRNKQFVLRDNFINDSTNEPFTLYLKQVPWSFSTDGYQIKLNGNYGQRWMKQNNQATGWNSNFDIKIIKVIGYKN